MKEYKKALHVFRRDLRLQDNTALLHALKSAVEVTACFILDPRQLSEKNSYKSNNAIQFMFKSLQELDQELKKKKSKLYLFYGESEKIIQQLIKKEKIELVTFNKDYTPFSIKRDKKIASTCKQQKAEYSIHDDALLNTPEDVVKSNKQPYTVFTPYMRNARRQTVEKPTSNKYSNYNSKSIASSKPITHLNSLLKTENKQIKVTGGRKEGIRLINGAAKLSNYKTVRDIPSKDYTSHLSAHNKFGTVSIREVYHTLKSAKRSDLVTQLYWRDFFTNITYHFPHVLGKAFREKYQNIKWKNSKAKFNAWCKGETGFPIVDAGMRELNSTGLMHNRVRMIVASFLVKDLHIDWRWGEKYFAQQLVDYDPAVNNGNWQWAASTGCDAQPYFRIFNPWLQQKRFDPDCIYIKKWIPELKAQEPKIIHNLFKKIPEKLKYPQPMVDHSVANKEAIKLFK